MFSALTRGAIAAFMGLLFSNPATANLVTNPGFETFNGAFNTNGEAVLNTASTTLPGWGVTNNDIGILTTPNAYDLSSSEGINFLDLSGLSNGAFPKGVAQDISGLTVGNQYVLSLDIGIRNGPNNSCGGFNCDGPVEVTATIGATSQTFMHDSPDPGNVWSTYGFTFDASASTMELQIIGVSVPFARIYIGLDNVSVTAVPLPAGALLFGSALGLLGWLRRKAA